MLQLLKHRLIVGIVVILFIISAPSLAQAQGGKAALGVFENFQVAPGSVVEVPVSIRNVQDLYGLDLTMKFNPELLQVVDVDNSTLGIQASIGQFLDPGLLLFNIADNKEGTIHFAMSQFNPSEPKSGEGIVLVIQFRGVAAGESPLTLTNLQLASREGIEIPSEGVNSILTIHATAPTQAATYPVAKSTSLIKVDPSTATPSPTVPVATATLIVAQKGQEGSPAVAATGVTAGTNGSGYFLVDNWWIVIILLAAVLGAGLYFFVLKRN